MRLQPLQENGEIADFLRNEKWQQNNLSVCPKKLDHYIPLRWPVFSKSLTPFFFLARFMGSAVHFCKGIGVVQIGADTG